MNPWKRLRILFLITTCSGVVLTLGKSILFPAQPRAVATPLTFPAAVPLPEWQFLSSHPLDDQNADRPGYLSGQQYRYQQGTIPLTIEMRYLVNTTGDVQAFIQDYSLIPANTNLHPQLRQHDTVGFYLLFAHQNQAYLSSCINPYGDATVTDRQFKANRDTYDIRYRLVPWLLGEELKDERCLWTVLSISNQALSPESVYPLLEETWVSWYQWWRSQFSPI